MSPLVRLALLACGACAALAAGACSTEDLHQDVSWISDPSNDAMVGFYLIRDDAYTPDPQHYVPHQYRYSIDGRFVTWGVDRFVQVTPDVYQAAPMPSGSHVLAIGDYGGGPVTATSPAVEAKPLFHPTPTGATPAVDPPPFCPYASVVFFGGASGMNSRVLVDDPAAVPAGTIHLRVMNALSDHQPLQVVQCPASVETNQTYTASDCAPVGDRTTYGGVYETNTTPDIVAKLGYYWAAPGVPAPAVAPINRSAAPCGVITRIPTEVNGPQDACPSCILAEL